MTEKMRALRDDRIQSVARYAPTRQRPTAADFIQKRMAERGSFRGDSKDSFYRAACKIAAADPALELTESPSTIVVAGKVVHLAGWELRRKA